MNNPKILIVGQYFELYSGGGITMTNLFKGWDKDKIAVIAENISHPDISVCNRYYQIGSNEHKHNFPFNLTGRKKNPGSGSILAEAISSRTHVTGISRESKLKKTYLKALQLSGLFHYKRRYKISNELRKWINDYSPDILYSQLSNIELIHFVQDLQKEFKLPVAIHIMDDWPTTISKPGLFQIYWHKRIGREFRKVLANASVLMSISEAMSAEYLQRYDHTFVPFHNPIDIKFWGASSKDYKANTPFIMLYAGRIGIGVQNSLIDIAEAIKCILSNEVKIEFHIQTSSQDAVLTELNTYEFVKLKPPVPYDKLPEIFAKADTLLLPNDFDKKSISFLKYSIPTKASEYMASGTPILLYSSMETAVAKHASDNKWAYVVREKNIKKLSEVIHEIYKNELFRAELGNVAKRYAVKHFDGDIIRAKFKNCLCIPKPVSEMKSRGNGHGSLNSTLQQ